LEKEKLTKAGQKKKATQKIKKKKGRGRKNARNKTRARKQVPISAVTELEQAAERPVVNKKRGKRKMDQRRGRSLTVEREEKPRPRNKGVGRSGQGGGYTQYTNSQKRNPTLNKNGLKEVRLNQPRTKRIELPTS